MLKPPMDLATFEKKAGEVAQILKAIGNDRRLMVLCKLVEHGERTVGDLADDVGLSQSALSQHLAKMRDERLVTFRRERQRSEEHTSELQSLMRISYAVFCLKKNKKSIYIISTIRRNRDNN